MMIAEAPSGRPIFDVPMAVQYRPALPPPALPPATDQQIVDHPVRPSMYLTTLRGAREEDIARDPIIRDPIAPTMEEPPGPTPTEPTRTRLTAAERRGKKAYELLAAGNIQGAIDYIAAFKRPSNRREIFGYLAPRIAPESLEGLRARVQMALAPEEPPFWDRKIAGDFSVKHAAIGLGAIAGAAILISWLR
jgi:hypothetical protein